jgi:hypothetical protein
MCIRDRTSPIQSGFPKIDNSGRVVWIGTSVGSGTDIFLYDGSTVKDISTINSGSLHYNNMPVINDRGEVVWYGTDLVNYNVYCYNIARNNVTTVYSGTYENQSAEISNGGQIAWQQSKYVGSVRSDDIYIAAPCDADTSISFDVLSTVAVTGNSISLGTVTAGDNDTGRQSLASVQSNCNWQLSFGYDPNFVRSGGATIPIGNLTARKAGTSDPYAALPTTITGAPNSTLTPLDYDTHLDVPWTVTPNSNPFSASATLTIVPAA